MTSKPPLDWTRVEAAMRKAAHSPLAEEEQRLVVRAFAEDYARYSALSQRVKREEVEAYKAAFRGDDSD